MDDLATTGPIFTGDLPVVWLTKGRLLQICKDHRGWSPCAELWHVTWFDECRIHLIRVELWSIIWPWLSWGKWQKHPWNGAIFVGRHENLSSDALSREAVGLWSDQLNRLNMFFWQRRPFNFLKLLHFFQMKRLSENRQLSGALAPMAPNPWAKGQPLPSDRFTAVSPTWWRANPAGWLLAARESDTEKNRHSVHNKETCLLIINTAMVIH